jgi:hypothetical protein
MTRAKPGDRSPPLAEVPDVPVVDELHIAPKAPEQKAEPARQFAKRVAPFLYLFSTVIFAGALALDPVGRIFIAPVILLVIVVAGCFLATVIAARHELRALVSNRRVRVIHGLEHGCLAILRERGYMTYSGATMIRGFSINVGVNVPPKAVIAAAREAIARFLRGDTRLAYSPYCGTSLLVGLTMFSLIIIGCTIGAIVFGVGVGPAFMAAAVLGMIAQLAWRRLGLLAQRALTVSTRFVGADVQDVQRITDDDGQRVFDVTCRVVL